MKFKYFFDSTYGTPGEDKVNKWLEENNNIKIFNAVLNNGCLAIFYEEKNVDDFKILSKQEVDKLSREEFFIYSKKYYKWNQLYTGHLLYVQGIKINE